MKRARKILVMLLAVMMLAGTCFTTNAANAVASIKTITVKQENANGQVKNVSSVTVYTNDTSKPIQVSYTWDKTTAETAEPVGVRVTSSDRGVVKVSSSLKDIASSEPTGKKNTVTTTGTLVLTPVSSGKATITITDTVNKKKTKKIKVTVKTYADDISFSDNVEINEENNTASMNVAVGGKRNLGAYITNAASDTKLTYKVENVSVKGGVTVDGKGNVSVKKAGATATVAVASKDGKVTKKVDIAASEAKVTNISFVKDTNETKDVLGSLNKKNVLCLKGNTTSSAYTYQLMCLLNDGAGVEDLVFTSSKPDVAVVNADGKITAVGNGKTVITAAPKLGNNKTAKITVKVTTDVEIVTVAKESFNILANNKDTAKLSGATNANASNKTVLYSILSVMDTQNDNALITESNEIKKYVTVDKKGNVKAKKPCVAIIRAYAKDNTGAERTVTVTASVPVDKITINSGEGQPVVKSNKVTLYKTGADEQQKLTLTAAATAKVVDYTPGNTSVTWKSNKPSVADVDENGEITAYGNGKAVITATAADGSGKKASVTVTVKTDAYEINVAKAQTVSGNAVVYVEGKEGQSKKYQMTSTVKAATNTDASNKKVSYSSQSISLAPGEEEEIAITANDKRTHDNSSQAADPVTKTVTLKCVDADEIARSYTLSVDQKEVQLLAGESVSVGAVVTPEEGKVSTDLSNVTWKSQSAGTASVANGVITAKKAGNTTITVSYKYDGYKNETDKAAGKITKNLTVSETIDVYVGRKTADVQKDVNKAFTAELKAENRDYTGINTTFNEKSNQFVLNIINPSMDFTKLDETGLVESMEVLVQDAELNYKQIEITDTETNDKWQIVRNGITVTVSKNGEVVLTDAAADEAITYVLKNTVGENKLLKDWNGKKYDVVLTVEESRSEKVFAYDLNYTIDVVMSEANYKQQIDQTISEGLAGLNIIGIEDITYDSAKNSMNILIGDVNQEIAAADRESRADVVAVLQKVFADAKSVTLTVETPIGKDVVTKERTEANSSSEFINGLLDDYVTKLTGRVKTYGELDGTIAVLDVTYRLGTMEYVQSYKLIVTVGEDAFDKAADEAIAKALENKTFVFGNAAYNAGENALSVEFNKEYAQKAPEDLAGTGIVAVLDEMIGNSFVDKDGNITVVVNGALSTVKVSDGTLNVLSKLTEGIKLLSELKDRTVVIKVPYKYAAGENTTSATTIVYSITFTLAEDVSIDAITDEMATEEEATAEEETTTEEASEEMTTEEETETEESSEETTTEEETDTEESEEETTTEEETETEESAAEEEADAEESTEETAIEETTAEESIEESSAEESTITEEITAEEVVSAQETIAE